MNLLLPREVRTRIKGELRRAGNREIGGFIMAEQLAPNIFRVADISVDHDTGSTVHFQRKRGRHAADLQAFFEATGKDYTKFNYLGEWHSHPTFSTDPSAVDIASMHALVEEPGIDFAVLMIVRLRMQYWLSVRCDLFVRRANPTRVRVM